MAAATNAFTATGNGASFTPKTSTSAHSARFNSAVFGTFVGTILLEKSFDGGTTFLPVFRAGTTTAIQYTAAGSEIVEEPEVGVIYRHRCSAFTSGTINTRLSN